MKRAIFIGQAMPRYKSNLHDWSSLNSWLYSIGITHDQIVENFFYSALVDYFPGAKKGSHRVPTAEEIEKERPRKEIELREVVGKKFITKPYGAFDEVIIIPLPHPSGASTWYKKKVNELLLSRALKLLRSAIDENASM